MFNLSLCKECLRFNQIILLKPYSNTLLSYAQVIACFPTSMQHNLTLINTLSDNSHRLRQELNSQRSCLHEPTGTTQDEMAERIRVKVSLLFIKMNIPILSCRKSSIYDFSSLKNTKAKNPHKMKTNKKKHAHTTNS